MICNKIELLAPAGTTAIGRAAIDAGADAVYIGGPDFSARAAAGNSIEEIGALCRYAHQFGAKVFLAINTLFDDDQLPQVRDMVIRAHQEGVDAFIVQHMAFLMMDLPSDIVLHASTQCANRTVERVVELERAGFDRIVLERGLSIDQIRRIRNATCVELEVFVHGAICVSYSGECYLSEKLCSRSANRGQCAQPCRSLYDLVDSTGSVLLRNEPLLSPRDLNLSARVGELIDAGVMSLKIEGRLKDERYVVNTVAHYNKILMELGVERTSYGVSKAMFEVDLSKTFSRGFTEYLFNGRQSDLLTKNDMRGKYMGVVSSVGDRFFTISGSEKLSNGDGIAFGQGQGTRINRVQDDRIYPLSMDGIRVSEKIYGTLFKDFVPRAERKISVSIEVNDEKIFLRDIYGNSFSMAMPSDLPIASNEELARDNMVKNLSKSGDTIFSVTSVVLNMDEIPFMPISQINALRRELFALYSVPRPPKPERRLMLDPAPCNTIPKADLITPLCPLYQYGLCLKDVKLSLPLSLRNNGRKIRFEPHCDECQVFLFVD